jgi:hypothetical protein
MVKFQNLFHGTSSVHKASILANGLLPQNDAIYLTTHPEVALLEADRTVSGEGYLRGGYKQGIGGEPLVVVIDRIAALNLKLDVRGYYDQADRVGYRSSELRFAFTTNESISPESITLIEEDLENECKRRLEQIENMTKRPTFDFAIKVDLARGRVYRC